MSLAAAMEMDYRGQSFSTLDLEKYYHRTGQVLTGPVEMRQAWFFNDLKPRTYFAQGCTSYFASRYVQVPFNLLLDSSPVTHRFRRFDLDRLVINPQDHVVVYDYTSFTSSMSEQRHFLNELASFCSDTYVHLVDTFHGVIRMNLGDLLASYNSTCNTSPSFRINAGILELLGWDEFTEHTHHCAGFLGVHGNLASCTYLHGLVLRHITGDHRRASCVGDDAVAVVRLLLARLEPGEVSVLDTVSKVFQAIELVGEVHPEKTKVFAPIEEDQEDLISSEAWNYLKKSLRRYSVALTLDRQFVFPSWALMFHKEIVTTRKMRYEMIPTETIPRICTQLLALRLAIHRSGYLPSTEEYTFLVDYMYSVYDALRLPTRGVVAGVPLGMSHQPLEQNILRTILLLPALPRKDIPEEFLLHPIAYTLREVNMTLDLPQLSPERVDTFVDWSIGTSFQTTGEKLYGLLEALGYLEKETVLEEVKENEILERLLALIDSPSRVVYRYHILMEVPFWAEECRIHTAGLL